MKKTGKTFSELKKEWLVDPKAKKAMKDSELEYKVLEMLMLKRINENLTQGQLAKKLGVKQPVISQFERGKFNPTIGFLKKFVRALNAELIIKIK